MASVLIAMLAGILSSLSTTDNQLVETGSWIWLASQRPIRKQCQKNLRFRSDGVAITDMTAIDATRDIGDRHMQVCARRAESS